MARWEDNAVGRLQESALELYKDPGYDKVTVAEIAERAGLTRRTFFRYFSDKREVLFFGAEKLEAFVAQAVLATPLGTPALDVVVTALAAVIRRPDDDPAFADFARQRHALIRTYAELRERELAKLASIASATAEALRDRGVPEPTASLAAEAGVAAFKVGFQRWVDDPRRRKLRHHVQEATAGLGALVLEQVATRRAPAPRSSRGRARA
jgi:AcrR family transcriptional regulator